MSHLRIALRTGEIRLAFSLWREEMCFEANWAYAIKYDRTLTLRLNLRAWRRHAASRKAVYQREEDARYQQLAMKQIKEEFDNAEAAEKAAEEASIAEEIADAEAARVRDKKNAQYWVQQRRKADQQLNDK